MNGFAGKTAIVTGAASGIGRAIGEGLVRRGAKVVFADLRGEEAAEAARAAGGPGAATAATLDVTDAAAFRGLVDGVARDCGRLDLLFNNAGIAVFGDTRDVSLEDWNRVIDVNLRGVVHGTLAAYPLMARQGSGHIVNTASAAGLLPVAGGAAYAATKHAVVGISTSVRTEAARLGVRVSAVCPGFIHTPILQSAKLVNVDREKALRDFPFRMYSAEYCAGKVLRGVERNRAIIVVTPEAHVMWRLYRLWPRLVLGLLQLGNSRNPLLRAAP